MSKSIQKTFFLKERLASPIQFFNHLILRYCVCIVGQYFFSNFGLHGYLVSKYAQFYHKYGSNKPKPTFFIFIVNDFLLIILFINCCNLVDVLVTPCQHALDLVTLRSWTCKLVPSFLLTDSTVDFTIGMELNKKHFLKPNCKVECLI